jgi:putative aldouronate transport system substrate-binding protein
MINAKPPVYAKPTSSLSVAGPLAQTLQDKARVIYTQSITAPANQFDRVYDAGIQDWLSSGAEAVRAERRQKYPN